MPGPQPRRDAGSGRRGAWNLQERSPEQSGDRGHPRERPGTRAPCQPQQNSLGLVVPRVGQQYDVRPELVGRVPQSVVPGCPGSAFRTALASRPLPRAPRPGRAPAPGTARPPISASGRSPPADRGRRSPHRRAGPSFGASKAVAAASASESVPPGAGDENGRPVRQLGQRVCGPPRAYARRRDAACLCASPPAPRRPRGRRLSRGVGRPRHPGSRSRSWSAACSARSRPG